ncbi:MAG: hypothetical protein ACRD2G_16080 [Terriglobia bacterium]
MRQKLETASLFGGMLAAVAIESVLIWWLWYTVRFTADPGAFYLGDWLGPLLPQAWLVGVTAAMIHRLALLVYEREKAHIHRHHFLRLSYAFLALASVEGCMLWIPLGRMVR